MQHFLKAAARAAGTQVVATELFLQLLFPVDDLPAALHMGFGREASATFAGPFKSDRIRRSSLDAWLHLLVAQRIPSRDRPCPGLGRVDAMAGGSLALSTWPVFGLSARR